MRKSSEAECRLKLGTGIVTINGKALRQHFPDVYHRVEALKPLAFTLMGGEVDVELQVVGGGVQAQAECCANALARALIALNPEFRGILLDYGLVHTDFRIKEPKRIGLYKARKRPPYVRR